MAPKSDDGALLGHRLVDRSGQLYLFDPGGQTEVQLTEYLANTRPPVIRRLIQGLCSLKERVRLANHNAA